MIRFNEVSANELGVSVKDIQREVIPSFNIIKYSNRGANGSRFVKRTIGERTISVTMHIKEANDLVELQRAVEGVARWLCVDEPKPLILGDRPDVYCLAIPTGGVSLSQVNTYGEFTVDFLCLDSNVYSINETQLTLTSNGSFEYNGTLPASWEMELNITSSLTEFALVLGDSNLTLNGGYKSGDKLVIDSLGVVLYNGVKNNQRLTLKSKVNRLNLGVVSYSIPSGVNATLKYHDTYIY